MGEEECRNGANDFLLIGGAVILSATLIVIAVSYYAGGYILAANNYHTCCNFALHKCPIVILKKMLPSMMLIVTKGGNFNPGSFFSPPFLFVKSCLLLVIASTEIWVCMKTTISSSKSPSAEYIR